MVIRIEYHNGDWDLLTVQGDMLKLQSALENGITHLKGTIEGFEAFVSVSALRCIRQWESQPPIKVKRSPKATHNGL